jgi:hypothetical protein
MARRDGLAATALALVAGLAMYEAGRLPFGAARHPGPGFVPWWVGLALAALSATLMVQAVRAPAGETSGPVRAREGWGRVAGLLVGLGVYVAVLTPLGYPIATFLLVLFMLRPLLRGRVLATVGLAVLASLGSYLLFAVWLRVPLPPIPFAP